MRVSVRNVGQPQMWSDKTQRFQLNELDFFYKRYDGWKSNFRHCYLEASKVSKIKGTSKVEDEYDFAALLCILLPKIKICPCTL